MKQYVAAIDRVLAEKNKLTDDGLPTTVRIVGCNMARGLCRMPSIKGLSEWFGGCRMARGLCRMVSKDCRNGLVDVGWLMDCVGCLVRVVGVVWGMSDGSWIVSEG